MGITSNHVCSPLGEVWMTGKGADHKGNDF
jgi:hypothetical protein